MSVKDFPPRPPVDSDDFPQWLDKVRLRLCIDDLLALSSPALGDELSIFDISADATRKVTLSDIKALIVTGGVTLMSPVAMTSGTTWDFTGIPSGVKGMAAMIDAGSTNGTTDWLIQLGDAGGFETGSYVAVAINAGGGTGSSAGFILTRSVTAASSRSGLILLSLLNASTFTWAYSGNLARSTLDEQSSSGGAKSLSAELTQVRFTTVGADTGDGGSVSLAYWS